MFTVLKSYPPSNKQGPGQIIQVVKLNQTDRSKALEVIIQDFNKGDLANHKGHYEIHEVKQ